MRPSSVDSARVALALVGLLAAPLSAQVMAGRPPASAASSFVPARLARTDSVIGKLVADERIPGAVVMIVRDGAVVVHKAYGTRDIGTKAPMRTDDIFRIASQTKAITSLAVMMLWEEGKFGLDDPIGRYLPEFRRQTILTKFNPADSSFESKPTARRITIRQLLTHTSGLDYAQIGSEEFKAIYAKAGISAGLGEKPGALLADKIAKLGALPLKHEPGERFTYGLSVDVLGRLVEVISGQSLEAFMQTRILTPLRMNDTYFAIPAAKQSRLVGLHEEKDGKLSVSHTVPGGNDWDWPNKPVTYFSGGGGLSGTTLDYARFLQLFLNGGELDGVRLVSRKTIEMMLTNQIGNLQPNFGLGFQLETELTDSRSPLTLGSFQWGGAFATTYWADPKEKMIALIYTNISGTTVPIGDLFKTLVYSALK
jgi:CubicO group peptidase (beta-lactamase class C family)